MPQLTRITVHSGFRVYFRCPYQAKVMNVFEMIRKITVTTTYPFALTESEFTVQRFYSLLHDANNFRR